MKKTLITFGGLLCLASAAQAQVSLAPAVHYNLVGVRPGGAVAADFNGDGFQDLAVTSDNAVSGQQERIELFRNNGNGMFTPAGIIPVGPETGPDSLVAPDVNGDGLPDIVVVLKNINTVRAYVNSGGFSFTQSGQVAVGANARNIKVGDIDGVGGPDFITANRDSNTASVILNGSVVNTYATNQEPREAVLADLNGDGRLDMAVANHDTRDMSVRFNLGGGAFGAATTYSVGGSVRPDGIAAADVDGDGDMDLATPNSDDNNISLMRNNGNGTFTGPAFISATLPDHMLFGDINRDGRPDMVTANATANSVSVLVNLGGGSFAFPQTFAAGTYPDALALADLNGDGGLDIVAVNRDSNTFSVFLNTMPNPRPWDVNSDGATDDADLGIVLAQQGMCSGAPGFDARADVNHDGCTDDADLGLVLFHQGE